MSTLTTEGQLNRVAIVLDENGDLLEVCADEPVTILIVNPHTAHDRVFEYAASIGPHHVRKQVGGYTTGHGADGRLGPGDGTGRKPPTRPRLELVKDDT